MQQAVRRRREEMGVGGSEQDPDEASRGSGLAFVYSGRRRARTPQKRMRTFRTIHYPLTKTRADGNGLWGFRGGEQPEAEWKAAEGVKGRNCGGGHKRIQSEGSGGIEAWREKRKLVGNNVNFMLYKTFAKDCSEDLAIYLLFRTKTIHVGRCDHSAVPVCDL
ncbi:hypothetical protein DVH05_017155 [Phytophthora capsici]|nr:hypothetical protein DVH05_017155 [Phytophthora capsici]